MITATILCVEDNPQSRRLLRKFLSAWGYQVLEASDGLTALTVTAREMPDLILMDVNLPDISGLDVTRRLQASRTLSSIPIVALTANAMIGDREACLAAGCSGYLAKPVLKSDLLDAVELHLERAAQRNQQNSTSV